MSSLPSKAWGQSIRTHQLETLVLPDLNGAQFSVISLHLFFLCRRERRPQSWAGSRTLLAGQYLGRLCSGRRPRRRCQIALFTDDDWPPKFPQAA